MSLIKDDGACILSIKLSNDEVDEVVNILKIQQADWSDDRDLRSKAQKEFESLLSQIDSVNSSINHQSKNRDVLDSDYWLQLVKVQKALGILREVNKRLV